MYNGVGLLTPRGSGTSGYVQTNKFNLRGGPPQRFQDRDALQEGPRQSKADESILQHKAKREIELKVAQEQAKLEDEGLGEADVAEAISLYRKLLLEQHTALVTQEEKKLTAETHELAQRKVAQMDKLANAFGIKAASAEGEAFNRELQEQKRQQAQQERENQQLERLQRQRLAEKERKKKEKEAKKAAKKAEKERKKREKERAAEEAQRAERSAQLRKEWEARVAGKGTTDRQAGAPVAERDERAPSGFSSRDRRPEPGAGIDERPRGHMLAAGRQLPRGMYRRDEDGPDRYEPDNGRDEEWHRYAGGRRSPSPGRHRDRSPQRPREHSPPLQGARHREGPSQQDKAADADRGRAGRGQELPGLERNGVSEGRGERGHGGRQVTNRSERPQPAHDSRRGRSPDPARGRVQEDKGGYDRGPQREAAVRPAGRGQSDRAGHATGTAAHARPSSRGRRSRSRSRSPGRSRRRSVSSSDTSSSSRSRRRSRSSSESSQSGRSSSRSSSGRSSGSGSSGSSSSDSSGSSSDSDSGGRRKARDQQRKRSRSPARPVAAQPTRRQRRNSP